MTAQPLDAQPDHPNYRHARDIPDVVFLLAVAQCQDPNPDGAPYWAMRSDVNRVLGGLDRNAPVPCDEVPGVPWKVVLAKFRRVKKRGLVDGCDCGCRGDFELTTKGRLLLVEYAIAQVDITIATARYLADLLAPGMSQSTWNALEHSMIHHCGLALSAASGAATEFDYHRDGR